MSRRSSVPMVAVSDKLTLGGDTWRSANRVLEFSDAESGCYIQMVADGLPPKSEWIRADFNGLFDELLCLSHGA